MAYGEKFYLPYCDRYGKQCRLSISQDGYVGASTEIEGSPIPIAINREGTNEIKQGGIFPTSATITLVGFQDGFNLEEIYTANEREYLITSTIDSELDWTGYIIPNGFSQDWDSNIFYITIQASDNLSTLQGVPFVDRNGDNYGVSDNIFERSFLWVAKEALKKTDILLPIKTMVDIKPRLPEYGKTISRLTTFQQPSTITFQAQGDDFSFLANGASLYVTSDNNAGVYTISSFTISGTITVVVDESLPSSLTENATLNFNVPVGTFLDPLVITVHDTRVYINDSDTEGKTYYEKQGGAMTTWDVLNNLAVQWNAIITQNKGAWEIKRWNADRTDIPAKQWFVYNSEGTLTGRENFGDNISFTCVPNQDEFLPFGHLMSMDRVFKRVIVNYKYKYKIEGDTLRNMINNPNFEGNWATGTPQQNIPYGWRRQISSGSPQEITKLTTGLPDGYDSGVNIEVFSPASQLTNLTDGSAQSPASDTFVNKGDKVLLSFWEKKQSRDSNGRIPTGVYYISLYNSLDRAFGTINPRANEIIYNLVNDGFTGRGNDAKTKAKWRKKENNETYYAFRSEYIGGIENNGWVKITVEIESVPISGYIAFEIAGMGRSGVRPIWDTTFRTVAAGAGSGGEQGSYIDTVYAFENNVAFQATGYSMSVVVDTSNESVPQIHGYMYEQPDKYTDQPEDITVLTGDDNDPDHVSNIFVLDNSTQLAINEWDSWDNSLGWSALGLALAKSIMQLYVEPWHVIEGEFTHPDINWSSRFFFETLPGLRFVIMQGQIDVKHNTFIGTLVQIGREGQPELPPDGGEDGGNTVDPNWVGTGQVRCIKDSSNLNTGYVEAQEVDTNPASPTYGQTRWVALPDQNLESCPIGEPINYYWGAQSLPIDTDSLNYYPFDKDGDSVTVSFNNDNSDVYLVFLHRASLGTIQSITYTGGYESIGSWQYEPDVIIDGYTYKFIRLSYFTGIFSDLPVTFLIL